ncbi:hypothetical protein CVV70_16190 [Ralstonia solanacearum]|nr:hypothetical protein CVS51_11570 [Ralstonia solanacearum]PNQ36956.1 hypothetical protein CVV71_09695 [Ralstonia solanacearum]PNQ43017.1 hypothetical protein CVT21_08095 [Ralstonia solanacearum]PNQ48299.1 hypothetical protein CVV70_16190 [Ralstonia solanacearum]
MHGWNHIGTCGDGTCPCLRGYACCLNRPVFEQGQPSSLREGERACGGGMRRCQRRVRDRQRWRHRRLVPSRAG